MKQRLKCVSGSLAGKSFELDSSKSYILGREDNSNEGESIVLPSPSVSRRHCRIAFRDGGFYVEDLQSANGIRLNRQAVGDGDLKAGDLLQVGAFSFSIEGKSKENKSKVSRPQDEPQTDKKLRAEVSLPPQIQVVRERWGRFQRLDLRYRIFFLLLVGGIVIHQGITSPMISDMRANLLELSISIGENTVQSLADRNKRELADGAFHLLDCGIFKKSSEVLSSVLYDSKGHVVCPVGADTIQDDLLEDALYRSEAKNNCRDRILNSSESDCDFVFPVRGWRDQQGQYSTVGVARIRYSPKGADFALQNLQSLKWKMLLFCLGVLALIWAIWQVWQRREIELAVEGTHLAVTGANRGLENLESFAALDPLVQEINRLISKENQGLKAKSEGISEEASFLHSLLQQVLLLEERAVMVVDKDNQLIAASRTLSELVPVEVSRLNVHITEAITDTHLQGELIVLLNDLAQSNEVIDRALAMADRVLQARGMALFVREEFVASILVF